MTGFTVALVARDPDHRSLLARTFETAPSMWTVTLEEERPTGASVIVTPHPQDGDVSFDPSDPARSLEEVHALAARRASKVFIVTGAMRGCGVTSVALHLAQALARRAETCLVDLDTSWAGVAERLDLTAEGTKTWADAGSTPAGSTPDPSSEDDPLRLAALPVRGGFRVLLAPPGGHLRDEGGTATAAAIVRRAARHFARVVVDVPPGTLEPDLLPGRVGVLVAPATRGGMRRAAAFLEGGAGRRWALVLNRLGSGGQMSAAELARRAGCRSSLELPCTPSLRDAEEEARLLAGPWTRWNRRIERLAGTLERA